MFLHEVQRFIFKSNALALKKGRKAFDITFQKLRNHRSVKTLDTGASSNKCYQHAVYVHFKTAFCIPYTLTMFCLVSIVGTAEVNVLHDILGDSGGRDEFQEELESTFQEEKPLEC